MRQSLNMPVVSVIVPIYQAERTLDACLRSLKAQELEAFEVLMVNDGSADGSREICLHYAESDSRFRLLDQTNQGVSAARNRGLQEARGTYCQFVDSDDEVLPGFLDRMVQVISESDSDLVICDYQQMCQSTGELDMRHFHLGADSFARKQFLRQMTKCPAAHYFGVLWNKIYRLDLIRKENLSFCMDASLGEDFVFNTQYFAVAERIQCIEEQLYCYRWQQPDSLCTKQKDEEERVTERLRMYHAYESLFRRSGLHKRWKLLIQYYVVKAYFDELEYLGQEKNRYQSQLYQQFIRDSGIGAIRYGVFWTLKQLKQLVKR